MTAWWNKASEAEKNPTDPYSALAAIYDQVMDHVNYRRWALYVLKLARLHGESPHRVLELSCGTGNLAQELCFHGMHVLACDASVAMIKRAVAKTYQPPHQALFWCSDMRRIALRRPVDMALSLYDSMNYLLEERDWIETMRQIYHHLKPAGLFIFDVSTLHNSQETFAGYRHEERLSEGVYHRECYFDAGNHIQYNYFNIRLHGNATNTYSEIHRQRIRALEEVTSLISRTPFRLVASYSDFTLRPGSEKADRVHFVIQKAIL